MLVKYPTPNATTSVTLVTVMETPACAMVSAIKVSMLTSPEDVLLTLLRH